MKKASAWGGFHLNSWRWFGCHPSISSRAE